MKKLWLMILIGLTVFSCNKEKTYSNKLMKGEVWSIESLSIGGEQSEILGDWEVLQDVSIYDTVPTVRWVLSDYDALFDWQFRDKGSNFVLKYHLLCDDISEDDLDTLDYLVYDLSGTYNVEKHSRNRMEFRSENTQTFTEQMVGISIKKK